MVKRYRASSLLNQRISPERRTLIIARYKELKSLRAVANELKIFRNVFFLQEFDVLSGVHVDKLRSPFKDFRKRLKLVVEKKGYHIGY